MYRVEFYRWSELKQRYELVRTYWTDKALVDSFVERTDDSIVVNEDRQVYRYNVYGVPGRPGFVYYSLDNNLFPVQDKEKLL